MEISEQPSTGYIVVDENEYSSPTWISNLEAGKTYYVRITPFVNDSKTYEKIWGDTSAPVAVVTKPDKAPATLTHTKSTTNSITVNWSQYREQTFMKWNIIQQVQQRCSV